jgi:hypothetical protein
VRDRHRTDLFKRSIATQAQLRRWRAPTVEVAGERAIGQAKANPRSRPAGAAETIQGGRNQVKQAQPSSDPGARRLGQCGVDQDREPAASLYLPRLGAKPARVALAIVSSPPRATNEVCGFSTAAWHAGRAGHSLEVRAPAARLVVLERAHGESTPGSRYRGDSAMRS